MKQKIHESLERAYNRFGYKFEEIHEKTSWIINDHPEEQKAEILLCYDVPEKCNWLIFWKLVNESKTELTQMGFKLTGEHMVLDLYYEIDFSYHPSN